MIHVDFEICARFRLAEALAATGDIPQAEATNRTEAGAKAPALGLDRL